MVANRVLGMVERVVSVLIAKVVNYFGLCKKNRFWGDFLVRVRISSQVIVIETVLTTYQFHL